MSKQRIEDLKKQVEAYEADLANLTKDEWIEYQEAADELIERYTSDLEHYYLMFLWQIFGALAGTQLALFVLGKL